MIKLATLEDVQEISDLNIELFSFLNTLKEDIYNPIGLPLNFIYSMINSKEADYILSIEDEKVIGYALVEERSAPSNVYDSFKEDKFAYVYEIVVLPEYRLKGYGRELIDAVSKWGRQRNLTSIELNVLSNNYNAIAFYGNEGFNDYQIKLRKNIV